MANCASKKPQKENEVDSVQYFLINQSLGKAINSLVGSWFVWNWTPCDVGPSSRIFFSLSVLIFPPHSARVFRPRACLTRRWKKVQQPQFVFHSHGIAKMEFLRVSTDSILAEYPCFCIWEGFLGDFWGISTKPEGNLQISLCSFYSNGIKKYSLVIFFLKNM